MVVSGPLRDPRGVDSADGHHQRRRPAAPAGDVAASTPTTRGGDGRPVAAALVLVTSLGLAVADRAQAIIRARDAGLGGGA